MTDLNPDAKELVRAGRAALRPKAGDRERVLGALLPRLGAGVAVATASATAAAPAKATPLLKASALLVGVGMVGGGLYLTLSPERPAAKVEVPAVVQPAPAPPAPVNRVTESVTPAEPQPVPAQKQSPAPSRSADNLAQEVAILSRAGSELHAGRPAAALQALDEHRRKFPSGVLAQERTAARIQALCALGRKIEAEAELGRLARIVTELTARSPCAQSVRTGHDRARVSAPSWLDNRRSASIASASHWGARARG
jgi:hypothetical protein